MANIPGDERQSQLEGGGGNQRVGQSQSVGQRVTLNQGNGPKAHGFGHGLDSPTTFPDRLPQKPEFVPTSCALSEFHVGHGREVNGRALFEQLVCRGLPAQKPDQDVRVSHHDVVFASF